MHYVSVIPCSSAVLIKKRVCGQEYHAQHHKNSQNNEGQATASAAAAAASVMSH